MTSTHTKLSSLVSVSGAAGADMRAHTPPHARRTNASYTVHAFTRGGRETRASLPLSVSALAAVHASLSASPPFPATTHHVLLTTRLSAGSYGHPHSVGCLVARAARLSRRPYCRAWAAAPRPRRA